MTKALEKLPLVYVVGGNKQIEDMFLNRGYRVTLSSSSDDVGLVCFTGGEDVTPFLYGEKPAVHVGKEVTHFNPVRDMQEIKIYNRYIDVPKVGICRGAQFLNVMSGGTLWQDVDNHAIAGTHLMDYIYGVSQKKDGTRVPLIKTIPVTSTHHQQMRVGVQGEIIGYAGLSTTKIDESGPKTFPNPAKLKIDTEIAYYWRTQSLCYQPHPEYTAIDHPCQIAFFELIADYFNMKGSK